MPKFQKFLLVVLFSAFSFYKLSQATPTDQPETETSKKPIFHPGTPSTEETTTSGCWAAVKKAVTSCVKKTKEIENTVVPVLEFALTFIEDGHLKNTLKTAIKIAQSATNAIQFNEDGSLKLPDGTQLQNAVFLVFSDNSKFFTEESKMFIPLVISQLPTSDYQLKMKLIGFIALVDNPTTSYLLSLKDTTGEVGLINDGTSLVTESFSLFSDTTESYVKTKLGTYFSEYIAASEKRTEAEKEAGGQRAAQSFLESTSQIASDYNVLISQNPAYQFSHLSQTILKGGSTNA